MLGRRKPTAHGDTEEAEGHVQRFEDVAAVSGSTALFSGACVHPLPIRQTHLMEKIAKTSSATSETTGTTWTRSGTA